MPVAKDDTIVLSSNNYGELTLNGSTVVCKTSPAPTALSRIIKICNFPKGLNLTFTKKASNTVTFDSLTLEGADGLSFDGLQFSLPPSSNAVAAIQIGNDANKAAPGRATNIQILNSDVLSTKDISLVSSGNTFGISLRDAINIRLANNKIHGARIGMAIFSDSASVPQNISHDITVDGNEFVNVQLDAIDIDGVDNLKITGNLFHEERPLGTINATGNSTGATEQHADFIQFQTGKSGQPIDPVTGAVLSYGQPLTPDQQAAELAVLNANLSVHGAVVQDNIMIRGKTDCHEAVIPPSVYSYNPCRGTQGIFARSFTAEAKAAYASIPEYQRLENSFQDFTITNNLVFVGDANAIAIYGVSPLATGGNGLTIAHNTAVHQYNPAPNGLDILRDAPVPASPYTITDLERIGCNLSSSATVLANIADRITKATVLGCVTTNDPVLGNLNFSSPDYPTFFVNYAAAANPTPATTVGQVVADLQPSAASGVPFVNGNPASGFVLPNGTGNKWYNTLVLSGL